MSKRAKGTGSIKQLGGKFYARWRIDGKDVYGPSRDTLDQAEDDRINRKPAPGQPHISNRQMPTLSDFARMCMDQEDHLVGWYGRSLKDSTYNTNETILAVHVLPSEMGKKKLTAIDSVDLEDWVKSIQVVHWKKIDGKRKEVRSLASASYRRRCHAFVSKVFSIARRHKLVTQNPASGIELPPVAKRLNLHLSDKQLRKLYETRGRTGSLLIVAAETGLRRSELTALKWPDVTDKGVVVTNGKNNDERNLIPLSQVAREAIDRQPKQGSYVFSTADGLRLSGRNVNRDVRKLMDDLEFPKETRLHDLRGKFVTDLVEAGIGIQTAQALARHTSPKTTLQFYLRTSETAKAKAIDKLAKKRRGSK